MMLAGGIKPSAELSISPVSIRVIRYCRWTNDDAATLASS